MSDESGVEVWVNYPLVQEVTGVPDTGYNPFFFSAEGDYLLFRFTDETFTRVLSALQNGSKTTYPDEAFQTVWEFLRNVEFPVSICDLVAECFRSDEEFRQSVIDSLKADPAFTQMISELSDRSTSPQIEGQIMGGDCDNDAVAGKVMAIIDKMNTRNVDFLEIVEVGTNDEERVSQVLSAIPVLGESPADEIINLIQGFLENFTENYAAAITDDWLASVYGDLFCIALAKEDCSLTFQDVFDYFNARAGAELSVGSVISNIFSFVVNGDFSTDDLVASGMYLIQLSYILAGQEFNGMSIPKMGAITRDAGTSEAWMDWDACGPTLPILIINPAGYAGGTYEVTGDDTALFTAVQDGAYYRVLFTWTENSHSVRMTSITYPSGEPSEALMGYYTPGSDPSGDWTTGATAGVPVDGTCYSGLIYSNLTPFEVLVTFATDC